ncbi:MAG TPA: hypothetical protein VGB63_13010 [Pedobacter sp.]|jgi:hypothetical protein
MAEKTRDLIKQFFESGDQPSQEQFYDLLDSVLFKNELPASHSHSNKVILDANTASFTTALLNKLNGIDTGANLFTQEMVEDIVGNMFALGTQLNGSFSYNDATGAISFTGSASGGGEASLDPEQVRDIIGAAIITSGVLNIAINDAQDSILLSIVETAQKRMVSDVKIAYWDAKVETTDPRLSDARTPLAHNHDERYFTESEVTTLIAAAKAEAKSEVTTALRNGVPLDGDDLNKLYNSLQTLNSIVTGTTPDANNLVGTIQELLAIFATYPEGVDLVTALGNKIETSAIINTLTEVTSGKVLDARQGKILNDAINAINQFSEAKVRATVLTSLDNTQSGALSATDSVLLAFGKIANFINGIAATIRGTALVGYVLGTNAQIAAGDSILGAFGKTQKQIDDLGTGKSNKLTVLADITANYPLTIADKDTSRYVTGAFNITVPSAVFGAGDELVLWQDGTSQFTIVAGTGMTLRSESSYVKSSGQFTPVTLLFKSPSICYLSGVSI